MSSRVAVEITLSTTPLISSLFSVIIISPKISANISSLNFSTDNSEKITSLVVLSFPKLSKITIEVFVEVFSN